MKGTNHLKYGIELAVLGSILLYPSDVKNTAIFSTACIISSVLPDIDTPESLVGKKVKPISFCIYKIFGHRKLFHSLLFSFISFLLLNHYTISSLAFGFLTGFLSHLFLDACTISGIPLFYPFHNFKLHFFNIKSGDKKENIILFFILIITIFVFLFFLYKNFSI